MVTCTSAVVLNQGDAVTFDIAATVVANPAPGNAVALYNEAVAATAAEITTADNLSPYVQVMVRGAVQADLGLTIVPGAASVPAGLPITVAATITNSGPNAASHVVFSGLATLTGFDQVSITPAANCPVPAPGAPVVCTFAFLAANASQTVVFTGTPHTADRLRPGCRFGVCGRARSERRQQRGDGVVRRRAADSAARPARDQDHRPMTRALCAPHHRRTRRDVPIGRHRRHDRASPTHGRVTVRPPPA